MQIPSFTPCRSDSECGGAEVCFPDGCGDPGRNIVVEVTPNSQEGLTATDLPLDDGLAPLQDLSLPPPTSIFGEIRRQLAADGGTYAPYDSPVKMTLTGESVHLPGVHRRYQADVPPHPQGAYSLLIGAGLYQTTVVAEDVTLPPVLIQGQEVTSAALRLDVNLPAPDAVVAVSGTLVRTPGILLTEAMDVQALHPTTLRPLAQRAPVSSLDGSFTLWITKDSAESPYLIHASPRLSGSLSPSRSFLIEGTELDLPLAIGEFGTSVSVRGQARSLDGLPIPNAAVYFEGPVVGGGLFRSRTVLTGSDGTFQLASLKSAVGSPGTLWIVPPVSSRARILRAENVSITAAPDLGDFECPDKLVVTGRVFRPDARPAVGVAVRASPLWTVEDFPLPPSGAEAFTDENGRYELALEPAHYRLDLLPGEQLPRFSRFAEVRPSAQLQLGETVLRRGRRVMGTVTAVLDRLSTASSPAAYAVVRFYRPVGLEGRETSVLLAEGLTDAYGVYTVIFPTR